MGVEGQLLQFTTACQAVATQIVGQQAPRSRRDGQACMAEFLVDQGMDVDVN